MASRPELVSMCIELGIDWSGMSIEEMKSEIRTTADKIFRSKKIHHSGDKLSYALKRFLTEEYDFIIKDVTGKKIKL